MNISISISVFVLILVIVVASMSSGHDSGGEWIWRGAMATAANGGPTSVKPFLLLHMGWFLKSMGTFCLKIILRHLRFSRTKI